MTSTGEPTWHQAVVFALTGERRSELGRQSAPDLDALVAVLGAPALETHPVPPDLMVGIGAAQFWAVLTQLRRRLGLANSTPQPVLTDRPLGPDERRLAADAPPHHL